MKQTVFFSFISIYLMMAYSTNEIKICRPTLKILKLSLIWPTEDEEMSPGKWYYIRVATFLVITSLWGLSLFMHMILAVKNNIDIPLSEDFGFLVALVGLYYMTINYVKNQPKVALLLRDLSKFDEFGKPPGFEEEEKKLGFWSQFLFYYTVFGIIIYNLVKLIQKPDCERVNVEKGLNEVCGILTATWFPFNVNYFPLFHLVFIYVFISSQLIMKMALMISYNALEIAHHIILRINHLKIMIIECFDNEDDEICRARLKRCILYHLQILNLSSQMDNCFSSGMLAHLTITAAIFGCIEKQFVDGVNRLGSSIHFFGWFFALFVACLGGQHLINAGESIPDAIWNSKWYRVNPKLRKDLLFMLSRSQKGLKLSVGSFSFLSFSLLVSVLKMSYSILAMLTS